jgi:fumarylacetoacetase
MKYLQDYDEIVLDAWCGSEDGTQRLLGFGECRGIILPSL